MREVDIKSDDLIMSPVKTYVNKMQTLHGVKLNFRCTNTLSAWADVTYEENDFGRWVVVDRGPVENNNVRQVHECDVGHE